MSKKPAWAGAERDANEGEIIAALEKCGCRVMRLHEFDLLVARARQVYMLEVKTEAGDLTSSQRRMIVEGWPLHVVRNPIEAIKAVGL